MRNDDPFFDLVRSLEERLKREGDLEPEDPPKGPPVGGPTSRRPGGPPYPPSQGNPRWFIWGIVLFLLFLLFSRLIGFYADWIWYDSLGFASVFFKRIWAAFGLFVASAVGCWLVLAANIWLARRLEPRGLAGSSLEQISAAFGLRATTILLAGSAIFAFLVGVVVANAWEALLLYFNQRPFNLQDPVFQADVSFFMFTLPIWQGLRTTLFLIGLAALAVTALTSGIGWRGWYARRAVLTHLSVLGAILLLLVAWQYRLNAYDLVYSERGAVFGAGYTDLHAQLPAYNLLSIVTVLAALLLIVTVYLRRAWRAIVAVVAVWALLALVAGNLYPSLVQRFQVSPNELNLERPFIENNIQFTRAGFDLANLETSDYDASNPLTADALLSEPQTVRNIRLWDYRPLGRTYNQVQALRQYYEFLDIDVDRYVINGELRQVMLSVRELAPAKLAEAAQTWVNRKLFYTHGYGVAVSSVAEIGNDGLPVFLLKDLPATGIISVTQPQIYFGEQSDAANPYVIGRTDEPEFDYPRGEGNVTTHFSAETGIPMSLGARLLFALHFADINLLLNQDISAESRLLWRRNIVDRIRMVAPFLYYDSDPYIVISDDGRLYWFLDAFTFSSRFPYSEPYQGINYIRNSVKVVTNAYDGTIQFYVVDEADPMIAAYQRIFPDLFLPFSAMPADLQDNIRYPNDLFELQADVYRTYHMIDVNEFYNREDTWAWPKEQRSEQQGPESTSQLQNEPQPLESGRQNQDNLQVMEPYYVLMQLPETDHLEFIQILPFTPANRENMIAWMAVRNDPATYGQKLVYEFGKDTLIYGPSQIEARINQDPTISAQLTLWNQLGSSVIRGNLLVIPIGDSLLYVEPLFLQAANGNIPELKRVIVASADRVAMAENLGNALAQLVGQEILSEASLAELAQGGAADVGSGAAPAPPASAAPATDLSSASVEQLILRANTLYEQGQAALRNGEWAAYGVQMEELRRTLQQLLTITGQIQTAPVGNNTPAATPTASP